MVTPNNLFLAPCSRTHKEGTYRHFRETVLDGIDPATHENIPEFEGDQISVWGVVSGNQSHWDNMQFGDIVLFYSKTKVYTHMGTVVQKQESADLADHIWTTYDEGRLVADLDEPWPYIFYLTNVKEVNIPSQALHSDIGWETYYPQKFTRVIDKRRTMIEEKYGSIAACLRHHRMETSVSEPDKVEAETSRLLDPSSKNPPLTEDQSYTEQEKRIRSRALREAIYEAYDESCAFCGSQRRTFAGTPEVETAHIYPKSEDGIDDVRNGIALCRFHHWAFDTGWAAIDEDYQILIRARPEYEAYDDLQHLHNHRINLPDETELYPHQKFIEAHQELHGFK